MTAIAVTFRFEMTIEAEFTIEEFVFLNRQPNADRHWQPEKKAYSKCFNISIALLPIVLYTT